MHRLGVYGVLGRSFKTTNCLESGNALIEERCAKVDHWKNSSATPAVAGDSPRGHRTPLEEGDRLPPSSEASRSSQAGTEDRDEDINGVEEEGRLLLTQVEQLPNPIMMDFAFVRVLAHYEVDAEPGFGGPSLDVADAPETALLRL